MTKLSLESQPILHPLSCKSFAELVSLYKMIQIDLFYFGFSLGVGWGKEVIVVE